MSLIDLLRSKVDDPDPVIAAHARNRLAALEAEAGGKPPAYPSLTRQLGNLAGSLATWARAGFPVADEAERERRKAICLDCPSGMYDHDAGRCRACGCFGSLKPWMATALCPRDHWGDAPAGPDPRPTPDGDPSP